MSKNTSNKELHNLLVFGGTMAAMYFIPKLFQWMAGDNSQPNQVKGSPNPSPPKRKPTAQPKPKYQTPRQPIANEMKWKQTAFSKTPTYDPRLLQSADQLVNRLLYAQKQQINPKDRIYIGKGLSKTFGKDGEIIYARFCQCLTNPSPNPRAEFRQFCRDALGDETIDEALQRLQLILYFAEKMAQPKVAEQPSPKISPQPTPKTFSAKEKAEPKPNPWTAGPSREADASLYSPNPDLTYAKADCPPPKAQNGQWVGGKGSGKFPNPMEVVPRKPKVTIPEIVRTVEQFITAKRPYVRVVDQLETLPPILASKGEVYQIAMGMFPALGPGGKLLFRRICARVEHLELNADRVYVSVAKLAENQMDGVQAMRLLDGFVKRAEGVHAFQVETAQDAIVEEVPAERVEDSQGCEKETVITENDDFQITEPRPASETPLSNTSNEVGTVGLSRKMPVSASVEIAPELLALKGDRKPPVSGCYPLLLLLAQKRASVEAKTSFPVALHLAPALPEFQGRILPKTCVRGFAKSPDARSNSPPCFLFHTPKPLQQPFSN